MSESVLLQGGNNVSKMHAKFHAKFQLLHFNRNGGWILDNFPRTRDQWNAMVEKSLLPDDIVCLRDESENGDFLVRRWYQLNRADVDAAIQARLEGEAEDKRRQEEEAR